MDKKIHVRVNTPEKILWEGEADSLSAVNESGPFDILRLHANFITFIENKPIKIKTGTDNKEYTFERAVLYVHSNNVYIYAHI